MRGRSRNPDKESNLTSNSSSGPTSFRRKTGSPLTVHVKLNSISLTGLCLFRQGLLVIENGGNKEALSEAV